jgi:hypothetical protein
MIKTLLTLFSIQKNIINYDKIKPPVIINGLQESNMEDLKGYDSRYDNNTNYEDVFNVAKNYELDKLLKKLESKNINNLEKMNILEEYSFIFNHSMAPNITAGGLLDDYNFEF